jgi:deoxyribonuclease V
MVRQPLHAWTLNPLEAMQVQSSLRTRLALHWDERPIHTVGGVDVSLGEEVAHCAIVVLRYPELTPVTSATADAPLVFPYVPGLLAFREGPAVLAAWQRLSVEPDLVMFDGQGLAHPRGVGIACQMGLWLERPTIGVAKSRLYGQHEPPGLNRGDWAALHVPGHPERVIGVALRSKPKTNPLYVSPGHLMDVEHALSFVMACCTTYRLPEPTRWAHKVAAGESLSRESTHGTQATLL